MSVIPAKAGTQSKKAWAPAFAGVTILWLVALLFFGSAATAQTFPQLTGRVVDDAHLLTPAQKARISAASQQLERSTSDQLVAATVNSLGGRDIKSYATDLGNRWGVGRKSLDNGVLIVVAPDQHQARIAVGKGLNGLLTDARAAAIMRDMIPYFRANSYGAGIEKGEDEIVRILVSDKRRPQRKIP